MKFYKIIFFLTTMTGTLITISSYSWMSMWMGLEVNLLSIIPLLKDLNNQFPTESVFKYFIIQSMASTAFLFSMIFNMAMSEQMNNFYSNIIMIIFYSSILTKMGAAPFHAWFPEVLEGLNWMNCLLMLTWQKIAPMMILMQNFKLTTFLILVIITSSMIGGILGLNQISLRKIMAYSSINHIAWMISAMTSSKMIWSIYFLTYSFITFSIVITLKVTKTFFIHQMSMFKSKKILNLSINLNFLSLGGLPPFLGFLPKWLTINFLINQQNFLLTLILIIFTLISLYVYTRMLFSSMMISSSEVILKINSKQNFLLTSINFTTLMGLVLCPLIFNSI